MSNMKCPFCGAELQEFGGGDFLLLHYCDNINCNLYHIMGQYTLWQELIRTRKALELAITGLKNCKTRDHIGAVCRTPEYVDKILGQINTIIKGCGNE